MVAVMLGRLALVLVLAAPMAGCVRMQMVSDAQSTGMTGGALNGRGRIAVHVGSENAEYYKEVGAAVKKKYAEQLAASGFEVVDIAQAREQDLVLRATTRYFGQRDDDHLPLSAITLFLIPATGTSNISVDTTLIRNGEVLGTSRQTIVTKYMYSITPLSVLFGAPLSVELVEPHVRLNTDLIRGALPPATGKEF